MQSYWYTNYVLLDIKEMHSVNQTEKQGGSPTTEKSSEKITERTTEKTSEKQHSNFGC